MKSTMYFNSEAEMNEYFPNGVPSNVLAIVQPEGSDKSILFTTSNNNSKSGTIEDMGGYNIDDENEEKIEYSYVGVQDWYANGATQSYVVNYVAEHGGGGSTPDLSAYVTKDELSAQSYLTAVPAEYITDAELSGMSYVTSTALENASYATQTYVVNYVAEHGGGGSQVQADWNESDSTYASYILNKPTLNFYPLNGGDIGGDINLKSPSNGNTYKINFYDNHSNFSQIYGVNYGGIRFYSSNGNILFLNNQGNILSMSCSSTTSRKIYAYGIGNYNGNNQSSAYDLAYVINDIQTNLGAANSIAELILGE